jgi:hypothetical protein
MARGWQTYFTAGLVTFTSGVTVYLLLSDAARRSEVRRRKLVLSSLDVESPMTPLETATTNFGVLRIGGRFVNPFLE